MDDSFISAQNREFYMKTHVRCTVVGDIILIKTLLCNTPRLYRSQ